MFLSIWNGINTLISLWNIWISSFLFLHEDMVFNLFWALLQLLLGLIRNTEVNSLLSKDVRDRSSSIPLLKLKLFKYILAINFYSLFHSHCSVIFIKPLAKHSFLYSEKKKEEFSDLLHISPRSWITSTRGDKMLPIGQKELPVCRGKPFYWSLHDLAAYVFRPF